MNLFSSVRTTIVQNLTIITYTMSNKFSTLGLKGPQAGMYTGKSRVGLKKIKTLQTEDSFLTHNASGYVMQEILTDKNS